MADIKEKHGWISEKQAKIMRNCISINKKITGPYKIYLNENGKEVRVTTVSNN